MDLTTEPRLSYCVYVCAFVHAYVCWGVYIEQLRGVEIQEMMG